MRDRITAYLCGRSFADMSDLVVKDQYLICQYTDQIPDQFLMVIAGGWAGCQKTIDIQKENVAIFFSDNTDI